jgi:hypothetical protein
LAYIGNCDYFWSGTHHGTKTLNATLHINPSPASSTLTLIYQNSPGVYCNVVYSGVFTSPCVGTTTLTKGVDTCGNGAPATLGIS